MTTRSCELQWILPVLFLGCGALQAQSGAAVIADEATVFEEQATENGGGGADICIGNLAATTATRRAFVRYTLPPIPTNATVERVVLQNLQVQVRQMGAGTPLAATLLVRRVTADWAEGTGGDAQGGGPCSGGAAVAGVNWNTQPMVAAADSADAALSANDNVNIVIDTDIGTADDGLIADVQAWVVNGASNFGWRLAVAEEATANNARRLTPGTLTIYWSVPELVFVDGFESPP